MQRTPTRVTVNGSPDYPSQTLDYDRPVGSRHVPCNTTSLIGGKPMSRVTSSRQFTTVVGVILSHARLATRNISFR